MNFDKVRLPSVSGIAAVNKLIKKNVKQQCNRSTKQPTRVILNLPSKRIKRKWLKLP